MKRLLLAGAGMLLAVGSMQAQVTITPNDIPVTPGTQMYYTIESDTVQGDTLGVPVDISAPGPNQQWDFRQYSYNAIELDTLFDPATSAYADSFPGANRGQHGGGIFGLDSLAGSGFDRFESVSDTAWNLLGVHLDVDFAGTPISLPFSFPAPIRLAPLPLQRGDQWSVADTLDYIYNDSTGNPLFLIELTLGGFSDADADGHMLFLGGEADCIRLHVTLGGMLNVYPYLFGQPLPIAIYTQEFPATQTYTWLAPGYGELVTIASRVGEQQAQFTQASSIRRRTLDPNPSAVTEPGAPLPELITLAPAYPNPFNASTTLHFTLGQSGNVHLAAFDILGRQVAELAHGPYGAGIHHLAWQPNDLPSGLYFIHLESGGVARTVRAVLLK